MAEYRIQLEDLRKQMSPYDIWESGQTAILGQMLYDIAVEQNLYPQQDFFSSYGVLVEESIAYYDIGKASCSHQLYATPHLSIQDENWTYRNHVTEGLALLDTIFCDDEMSPQDATCYMIISDVIAGHHERYDGSGFPTGKSGEDLEVFGVIAALCQHYIWYRGRGMDSASVLEELTTLFDGQFAPQLVDLLPVAVMRYETHPKYISCPPSPPLTGMGLHTYYSPIFYRMNGWLQGYEGLAYLRDPKEGLVSQELFMTVALHSDRVFSLAKAMLQNIIQTMDSQQGQGHIYIQELPAQCLCRRSLINDIARWMRGREGTPLILLFYGLGEVIHREETPTSLKRLQQCGIQVGAADFGGEYSLLADLKDVSLDCLRLSHSLTGSMASNQVSLEIVRSICQTAQKLHIKVLSKSIKDVPTMRLLEELHCHTMTDILFDSDRGMQVEP